MQPTSAAILAAVAVVLILVAAAYVWYTFGAWKPFSYVTGEAPSWSPAAMTAAGGAPPGLGQLRFRNCAFTATRGDLVARTLDVSGVLNGMAAAYAGEASAPSALTLATPAPVDSLGKATGPAGALNAFSFQIVGFNDPKTVPDPTIPLWTTARATLSGEVRVL